MELRSWFTSSPGLAPLTWDGRITLQSDTPQPSKHNFLYIPSAKRSTCSFLLLRKACKWTRCSISALVECSKQTDTIGNPISMPTRSMKSKNLGKGKDICVGKARKQIRKQQEKQKEKIAHSRKKSINKPVVEVDVKLVLFQILSELGAIYSLLDHLHNILQVEAPIPVVGKHDTSHPAPVPVICYLH